MSRLIIKNLPFSITDTKLRNTFAKHGSITDLQLKYTKEGKFRGFAFIGYTTEDEAKAAKNFLDGTFVGAAKIKVESCEELGKSNKNKKEKKDQSKDDKSRKEKKEESELDKYKDDPKFKEFMSVHNNRDTWSNNNSNINSEVKYANGDGEEVGEGDEKEKDEVTDDNENDRGVEVSDNKPVSDLDYLKTKKVKKQKPPKPKKDLFTVKISNLPFKCKKRDLKTFFNPLKPASLRLPPKIKGIAFIGFLTEKEQIIAINKHKSFLGEHQINVMFHKENSTSSDKSTSKWAKQEASLEGVETVGESGRIFIRNLPYSATEDDISNLFSKYGPLTETTVPVDKNTRKYKGFAFVTFMMPEHAVAAFSGLDGSTFMGRLLHLIPAKPKESENDNGEGYGTDFKKQKEAKLKAGAGNSYNWNSLFLGVNAVADVMSSQYGVDKTQVLLEDDGKKGASAAVKLALGETEIVGQTRAFLEQEGVRLDAFNRKPDKRSKNIILAKNLPSKTAPEQLRDMFSKFGVIHRLVMPNHCLSAIIEFAEPSEARAAFMKLAYTKFHNAPLYLEWAPDDTFFKPHDAESGDQVVPDNDKEVISSPLGKEESNSDEPEEGSTLFVKNINFNTSDESLLNHFKGCGKVHSANVATKKNTKTDELLSMGFGFVTYVHKASAEKALKNLQHSRLDDHCLELKRSTRASTAQESNKEKVDLGKASTKILVRNIPFQAKKQEISQLFRTFGELSAVRLPSKMAGTGEHRGFAFIEFSNLSDARAAFSSLVHSTHLYGRRLVLEWAQGEETLEELRDKTRKQWGDGSKIKRARLEIEKEK